MYRVMCAVLALLLVALPASAAGPEVDYGGLQVEKISIPWPGFPGGVPAVVLPSFGEILGELFEAVLDFLRSPESVSEPLPPTTEAGPELIYGG